MQFIQRTLGLNEITIYPCIGVLNTYQKPIIYSRNDQSTEALYILMPISENEYKNLVIDSLFEDVGGQFPKQIKSILITNIDKDKDDELVILTKSEPHNPRYAEYGFIGSFYDVFVYDNINSSKFKLKNISKKYPEFTNQQEGYWIDVATSKRKPRTIAKFKDINTITQHLNYIKKESYFIKDPALVLGRKNINLFISNIINKKIS